MFGVEPVLFSHRYNRDKGVFTSCLCFFILKKSEEVGKWKVKKRRFLIHTSNMAAR